MSDMDDPKEFAYMPIVQRQQLTEWILTLNLQPHRPGLRRVKQTSYGLKHLFEHSSGFYVTNGQFKGAMYAAGFNPKNPTEQNWEWDLYWPNVQTMRAYSN